ncbi:MAG: TonB-dependent receptor domain-containing protein [Bryobacteraceae bacterium]
MQREFAVLAVVCIALLLFQGAAPAQTTTGTIFGTVADSTGAVIPQVEVTATNVATNFAKTATTDASGRYQIQYLPLGAYRVEVTAAGFKKFSQSGIVLEVDRNARVDPKLEVGAISDTVEVRTDAPLVETTNAALGHTVNNTDIINLPLVNRDVYSLLELTPGVDSTSPDNDFGPQGQVASVNGSANGGMGGVQYTLDGGSNNMGLRNAGNPAPNPDAVQEFRVTTHNFDAEFGRFAGGVVNVVTKSGTNAFHGSVFEFLRNDKLNAAEWNSTSKAPLRRNQFGGGIGGPVRKDRLFFFASYSGLRQRQSEFDRSAKVPTALERVGDFSASRVTVRDPLTRQPFPGNRIPAARIDRVATNIMKDWVPAANLPGGFVEVQEPTPYTNNEGTGKLDYYISASHQLTGSYFTNRGENAEVLISSGNLPWTKRIMNWNQQNINARETWTLSPSAINQFQLSFVRHIGGRLNTPQISMGDFGSAFQIQGPKALPRVSVRGYFNLYTAIAGPLAGSNYYQLKDVFSLNRGRHALKIGFEEALEKTYQLTELDNYGRFDFRDGNSGDGMGDFLLGLPRQINQDAPVYKTDSGWYTGMFIQDEFRVHPRLTLNLGFRYEIQFPLTDPMDRKNTFQPGVRSKVVPTAPLGMLFPGDPGISRAIIRPDLNNFAPRIGFAWDPFGDGKTSVRAGYGVYYGSMGGNMANGTADRPPFTLRYVFAKPGTLTNPYLYEPGGVCPFPYFYSPSNPRFYPTPVSMKGRDPNFRWPYTHQINFSIQRQLAAGFSVTAAYVSSLSHKLPTDLDINYPVYGPGATASNYNDRRPYREYTDITMLQSQANAAYHGLQISADKRMSRTFAFKGYYTFGKGLEDYDLQGSSRDYPQNSTRFKMDRGRTSNDRRHRFLMSAIWQLDYFRGTNPAVRAVLGGWSVSSIIRFLSGDPFTVGAGNDINLDGQTNDRADLVGNPYLDPNRPRAQATAMWFNTAAFKAGALGTDGNSGRNILDSPGIRNVDLGLLRDFRLREGWALQFRAEMTNFFNLVNLSNPQTGIGSAAFGSILTAGDMRKVQLGLRMTF